MSGVMHLGTATREITPAAGAELSGYLLREQPSLGVHDALQLCTLYLECHGQRLLWLHADLLGFTNEFVAAVRQRLGQSLGLAPGQIVISVTHTHAGPATVPLILCGEEDPDYLCRIADEMESAAGDAMGATEPVSLVSAEARCDLAIDRRKKRSAHTDPRVGVLGWRRANGSYAAVLANYAMHNVALSHENRQISGDVAGAAARRIADVLSGRPAVLFTAGAAANVNPPRSSTDAAQVDAWGGELADAVVNALHGARAVNSPALRIDRAALCVPYQHLDAAGIETITRDVAGALPDDGTYGPHRYQQAVAIWRERMLHAFREGILPDAAEIELQRIDFGGVDLLCINAEIFSRFGDDLRTASGRERVYVIGYANGVIGYVSPAEAYDEGGYEIDSAFVFYGGLPLERGAYERICARADMLLRC
jgi:hypothetical protein